MGIVNKYNVVCCSSSGYKLNIIYRYIQCLETEYIQILVCYKYSMLYLYHKYCHSFETDISKLFNAMYTFNIIFVWIVFDLMKRFDILLYILGLFINIEFDIIFHKQWEKQWYIF